MADGPPETTGRRHLIISALGITQILAWGSSFYLPAVLVKPIAEATGWPFAWVIGGLSVGLLTAGIVSIRVGRLIDRYGGRPVLAGSSILLALGLVGLASAQSIVFYVAAWLVMGLGMGAGLYDAAFSTLGRLYGRSARGAITTLTLWGGFASTVCWPLSAYLVETVGWRETCLIYAALHVTVTLPLHLFVLPREEALDGKLPTAEAASPAVEDQTIAIPHRTFIFALLALILTTAGIIATIWSVHLITILQAGGIGLAAAVGLGALIGPSQVGARVVEMMAGNRHHPIWTMTAAVLLVAIGMALLWQGFPIPAVALISYGAGNGIFSIAKGTLPLALFGGKGYAILMGRLAMPSLIAQSAAPSLGAFIIGAMGSPTALTFLALLGLFNVAAVGLLWHISRQARAIVAV
jgi:MFS family permease